MTDEYGFVTINGEDTIHNQQLIFREIVTNKLEQKGII